jgi:hypothetical protein
MGRPCACCTSPRRPEIDTAIVAGVASKTVAASVGLSPSQIGRHKRKCLQPVVLNEAEQLSMLAARADEAYQLSGQNADVKSMCSALSVSLRALELSFRRKEELRQQQEARDLPLDVKLWTEAEACKFRAYMDVLQTTELPTVAEYAARFGFEGGKNREHDLLPIRN